PELYALLPRRHGPVLARTRYRQTELQERGRQDVRPVLRDRRLLPAGHPDRVQHPVLVLRPAFRTDAEAVHRTGLAQRRSMRADNGFRLSRPHQTHLTGIGTRPSRTVTRKAPMTSERSPHSTAAVIGGGMAGMAAAYQLHQAGFKVTVFET